MSISPLLDVQGLTISLDGMPIVRDLNFTLAAAETLAIVGESGSGKSLAMLALTALLPANLALSGRALFDGVDLLQLTSKQFRRFRGRRIAMIFQEPMRALNPLLRIDTQLREVLRCHAVCRRSDEKSRVHRLLREVGLDDCTRVARSYPFQLSGGMQQRVMIAMALAGEPQLLIADEPTTALDVCVQAGILDLLQGLQRERGLSMLLVSHDLSVVAQRAQRIAVMYAGQLVELGESESVMQSPRHPYTQGLLAAIARMDTKAGTLQGIDGAPPEFRHFPNGCAFAARCAQADEACAAPVNLTRVHDSEQLLRCCKPLEIKQ